MIGKHSALKRIYCLFVRSLEQVIIFLWIRHSEENSANLFAKSDRGLLKTCKSEPQIEKDHHLVRIVIRLQTQLSRASDQLSAHWKGAPRSGPGAGLGSGRGRGLGRGQGPEL